MGLSYLLINGFALPPAWGWTILFIILMTACFSRLMAEWVGLYLILGTTVALTTGWLVQTLWQAIVGLFS